MSIFIPVVALAALGGGDRTYPLYKQCDHRWADEMMGVAGPGKRRTICAEGCAMSCVAMVLAGSGFLVPGTGAAFDPGTLNAYLAASQGYECVSGDCDNLVLNAPDKLSGGRMRFIGEWPSSVLPMTGLPGLAPPRERVYLAHVRSPVSGRVSHFVLLLSYDRRTDTYAVLDPGFAQSSYARANVSDLLMFEMLPSAATVPLAYPLFKQCDPAWGADAIHIKTVCAVGCLMSSTSMALRQRGVRIPAPAPVPTPPSPGSASSAVAVAATPPPEASREETAQAATQDATPGTLNAWLRAHGGYVNGTDDLEESVVSNLDPARVAWTNASMHTRNDLAWRDVVRLLDAGAVVIANVLKGHHFVLVVGFDDAGDQGDTLYVNDPGFARASYSYANDVVGWRLYAMASTKGEMARQLDAIHRHRPAAP